MMLHLWECLHPGCGESFSAIGLESLLLHVNGHNKYFHKDDPVLDAWSLSHHPGYKAPDGSTVKREKDARLEPYGMCQPITTARDAMDWQRGKHLTEQDLKWLKGIRVGW